MDRRLEHIQMCNLDLFSYTQEAFEGGAMPSEQAAIRAAEVLFTYTNVKGHESLL